MSKSAVEVGGNRGLREHLPHDQQLLHDALRPQIQDRAALAAQVQITTTTDKQNIHRTHPNVPTFEVWLSGQLHVYQRLLEDARCDDAEEQMRAAFAHVSTINLGAHAFDAIKGSSSGEVYFPR